MYGTPFIYYISLSIARFEAFTVAKSAATPEEAFIRAYLFKRTIPMYAKIKLSQTASK